MNEKVLEVIIKLLAIIANIDGSAGDKRAIIAKFLKSHVNEFEVLKSMYLFDEYSAFARESGLKEAYRVARDLNKELSNKQKVLILAHLIEMVLADQELSDIEQGFMLTVCDALNIPRKIYQDFVDFILQNDATELQSEHMLLLNSRADGSVYRVKHAFHEGLDTTLCFLKVAHADMYFLRVMLPTKDLFMNGEQLDWEYIYPFFMGNTVKGGKMAPIFYSEVVSHFFRYDAALKVSFEARDVHYTFSGGRKGLQGISLSEQSGKLVALMGASGSGKSTLLNVLNGNLKPSSGTIKINGIDIYRYREELQGVIGYVPQDDLLIEALTVYQNLFYAARLCFGKAKDEELDQLVTDTLQDLGLLESQDLKVGNAIEKTISGGQRKRLNIGLELLRQPAIMFVDEPTSGLSSRDSENIIDLLRELALKGKLVFVVIHQPSSDIFKMFDKLLVLDLGGLPIYYGNPLESLTYFRTLVNQVNRDEESACPTCGNVNVEEVFKIIEQREVDEFGFETDKRKVPPEVWSKFYLQRTRVAPPPKVLTFPPQNLDIPVKWKQVRTFLVRDFLAKLNNRQYMVINTLQAPLLALILAFIVRFYQVDELTGNGGYFLSDNLNLPSYIFMSIIVALFMGLTISAEEIIKDAKIRKREAFLQLSKSGYLISKVVILFSFSALQTFCYVLLGNYVLGIVGLGWEYWLVLFSCACFANMLGLNISASFNSVISIYILIPLLLIPQLILGGIVVKFDEINPYLGNQRGSVPFIAEIIAARWAFEAVMVAQFKDNDFEQPYYPYDKLRAMAEYKRVYYLPTLGSKLDQAHQLSVTDQEDAAYTKVLALLRAELAKELEALPGIPFPALDDLVPARFDLPTLEATRDYLAQLNRHYLRQFNQASDQKDALVARQVATPEGKEAYFSAMKQHRNERVVALVTNTQTEKRIIENEGRLIQKIYPIYLDPPAGKYEIAFNAHFYAPTKYLLGGFVSTLYYNVLIIWAMTLLLYAALYFEVLKGVIKGYKFFTFRQAGQ
jgi:ABC-type multidrug transport system ATPase subunit/uncharacterized tellurite resistance protein B-like protein